MRRTRPLHPTPRRPQWPRWVLLGALVAPLALPAPAARQQEPEQEQDRPAAEAPPATPPGRRERVGGLLAFQTRSEVRFVVPEGAPPPALHQLVVTYAFPERCRWQLEALPERPGGRSIVYRFGGSVWLLPPDEPESQGVSGLEAETLLTALELRRAAMLWPHGFAWCGEGEVRSADLAGGRRLVARLGPDGVHPRALESRRADGTALERLHDIEWRERDGRIWPARFELQVAGQPVWREEVLAIDPDVRHVDAFFRPHDTRATRGVGTLAPLLIEVPRLALRRVELPAGIDWPAALERFAAIRRSALERLAPLELSDAARFELEPGGRPAAVLLALEGEPPAKLPEGFHLEAAGNALALLVQGTEALDAALVRRLERARSEAGTPSGPPRVRLHAEGGDGPRAQILLPLAP